MNQVIIFILIIVNIHNIYQGWQKPGLQRKNPTQKKYFIEILQIIFVQ